MPDNDSELTALERRMLDAGRYPVIVAVSECDDPQIGDFSTVQLIMGTYRSLSFTDTEGETFRVTAGALRRDQAINLCCEVLQSELPAGLRLLPRLALHSWRAHGTVMAAWAWLAVRLSIAAIAVRLAGGWLFRVATGRG